MIDLRIAVDELDLDKINRLIEVLTDDTLLDRPSAILYNRIRTYYMNETDITSHVRWKRSQRAIRTDTNTLYDTGNLYRSIQLAKGQENQRFIGTDVDYAKYHQEGKGDMHRPFLGWDDETSELMTLATIQIVKERAGLI